MPWSRIWGIPIIFLLIGCGAIPFVDNGSSNKSAGSTGSQSPDTSQVKTKPPQELIRILLGEARGQIASEVRASAPDFNSPTAAAIAAVIRNRVTMIDARKQPGFFNADPTDYNANPPVSKYRAVIEARSAAGVPQFNPTDPAYDSYDIWQKAADKKNLDRELWPAYDEATIIAAGIFDGSIEDPTGGAFGFFSPTAAQYEIIDSALRSETTTLPANAGKSDASYPSLKPIQFLVLDGLAPKSSQEPYPAFIFVRSRSASDPAVTDEP